MLETFTVTGKQMIILFLFIIAGFVLMRTKTVSQNAGDAISKLCVNIFVPAISFATMAKYCRPEVLKDNMDMFIMGLVFFAVTVPLGILTARIMTKRRDTRGVYIYAIASPNYGYIGYPLVIALMGEAKLFPYMIFTLPFVFFSYAIGPIILNPNAKFSFKTLLNPTMILMALGIILGLTGGADYIPDFVMEFMDIAGDCMTPLGMILTGMVIGRLTISDMFKDYKTYIITALRLFILPLAGILTFRLLGIRGESALIGVLFLSLPGGVNTIVFPEAFGGDTTAGARIVFNTNILGVITIPLMLSLTTLWLG